MAKNPSTQGTALITGGAKRIGRAICLSLSSIGYTIAVHYNRSESDANKLCDEIKVKGGKAQKFSCDLSDEQKTSQLISQVINKFSDLNVLVNNASIFEPSKIQDTDTKPLHRHFATNFLAPYVLTSQFAKHCKSGHIINILDTHITNGRSTHAAYLLSKKALYELTKMSAVELAPDIRVNAVAPGLILPPEGSDAQHLDRLAQKIPQQTTGTPEQIGFIIQYLLSSHYVTGEVIFNDGGEHLK